MNFKNSHPHMAGFTLIEMLMALAVVAVLCALALPSFQGHMQRARRADALVSMMQVQLAQAQFRANASSYGTLADLGVRSASASGHYTLAVNAANDSSYEVLASAVGAQAADAACRHLMLRMSRGDVQQASGPNTTVANTAAVNRRCWNQ
jgi:type IV pilus assembly protein PilE